MKTCPRVSMSVICAMFLVTLSVPVLAKPADLPIWTPAPQLLSKLDPEIHFGTFLFRQPSGYGWWMRLSGAFDGNFVNLKRPTHADKTYSSLGITYYDNQVSGFKTPGVLLKELQKVQSIDATCLTLSPLKTGRVNGLPAMREDYQCKRSSGTVSHGCYYIIENPTGCILANAQDTEPYATSTLPLLETSVFTFHTAPPTAP